VPCSTAWSAALTNLILPAMPAAILTAHPPQVIIPSYCLGKWPTQFFPFFFFFLAVVGDFRKLVTVSVFRTETVPEAVRQAGLSEESG